ncbi:RNA-binding ATPase activator ESF2 [Pneumocystis jirovecii RU7]|uniref:18S rRNA factor 2 n=1 Tax=Pneumocystis jirovecii (strain RU7) TaxID=1408657 RepID=A0A0W4ZVW2_PNEJ7|nr:RNA-binding ATPase activator ESF2 [Pneumocystis jirovecii RU7]KTW32499.1 hypothetical protein T551_00589 [Pneumocystis jirovecii RU7]
MDDKFKSLNNNKDGNIESNININSITSGIRIKKTMKTKLFYKKSLIEKVLDVSKKSKKIPGIIYLSKIPPFMKPETVKHLLSQYGEIKRVFLTPENHKNRLKRLKFKGNKKKMYTEGWVEFKEKKQAKHVANTLNTSIIGGKPNTYYHDDIWNIKYLPKFKWSHLQEQIASENASRTSKLKANIYCAKRENQNYIKNYEHSRMIENIKNKKQKTDENITPNSQTRTKYKFKQREVIYNNTPINAKEKDEINTMLNTIL